MAQVEFLQVLVADEMGWINFTEFCSPTIENHDNREQAQKNLLYSQLLEYFITGEIPESAYDGS